MRLKRLRGLSLILLALACCSSCTNSTESRLKSGTQAAASWGATARMVCEEWGQGRVPDAYAVQTLRTARETLEDEARAVEEQSGGESAGPLKSLAGSLRGLGRVIEQMQAAVEKRDGRALAPLVEQLGGEERAVKALLGGEGVRP